MEPGCGEFLAGAAFTEDEHGPIDAGRARQMLLKGEKCLGLPQRLLHLGDGGLDLLALPVAIRFHHGLAPLCFADFHQTIAFFANSVKRNVLGPVRISHPKL